MLLLWGWIHRIQALNEAWVCTSACSYTQHPPGAVALLPLSAARRPPRIGALEHVFEPRWLLTKIQAPGEREGRLGWSLGRSERAPGALKRRRDESGRPELPSSSVRPTEPSITVWLCPVLAVTRALL